MKLNEPDFARKVRRALDEQLDALPASSVEKLAAARHAALSRFNPKPASPAPATLPDTPATPQHMENNKPVVRTPSVKRRLIAMVYESLLLFAVELAAVAVYTLVTFAVQSAWLDKGRVLVVVLTAAAYFIHAWTGSGHTLAMKTWRIKVVMLGQATVPRPVAIRRFIYAWGFFAPALLIIGVTDLSASAAGTRTSLLILLANIVLWAMTAFLDKDRQFLHDKLAGTRLIELPKKK